MGLIRLRVTASCHCNWVTLFQINTPVIFAGVLIVSEVFGFRCFVVYTTACPDGIWYHQQQ